MMSIGCLYTPQGGTRAAWRLPQVTPQDEMRIGSYVEMARLCERGLMDLFFIADSPTTRTDNLHIWTQSPLFQNGLEPVTLLSAVAVGTTHIGLGGTVSTSFFEPFNIARQFASLDHISGGRAAWNVVTSANDYAARNFGLDRLPPHAERYGKARESVAIVKSYWDTWEDDAFLYDKQAGLYFDPAKYHVTEFKGDHFRVYGGLNVARTPQGRPVIIQAGASESGKDLAAETADVVFATNPELADAVAFYRDLKGRLPAFGRTSDDLRILQGVSILLADTEEEALARKRQQDELIPIESRVMMLNTDLETNLLDLPLDEPIPLERIPASSNFHKMFFEEIAGMARSGMTLREIAVKYNRAAGEFIGTPLQLADHMQHWVEAGACDGFMFLFSEIPGCLNDFVEKVVPILQARGLYRTAYSGTTLRDHLGLRRPDNTHLPLAAAAE